ncbi:MAG: PKD domain-containing protein [Bacteroidetes bacterium]|nr:PKD domain-containing protein [Bacteroidota bacterium]
MKMLTPRHKAIAMQYFPILLLSLLFSHTSYAQPCETPADFTWTASGCTVTFQALNTTGTEYLWSFDNQAGTSFGATGTNPTVTFPPSATSWQVRLAVDNEYGCVHTLTLYCFKDCDDFGFTFEVDRCDVTFTAPSGQGIVKYSWDFGDGYTASGLGSIPSGTNNGTTSGNYGSPTHSYSPGGDFQVCLTVSVLVGGEVIYDYVCCKTVQNVCSLGDCRDCSFTATPSVDCGKLTVKFESACTDPTANHCWNFGDGSPTICGNFPTIEHTYSNLNTSIAPTIATHSIYGQTPCSLQLDLPRGIFIGKDCESTSIKTLIQNGVLPAVGINGNNYPGVNIYLSGNLKIDENYEFKQINVFTGVSTQINVAGISAAVSGARTLRLTNGTYVGPQVNCECLWEGIRVFKSGKLITSGTPRVEIAGALYAVRAIRTGIPFGSSPSLQLNDTNFNRNFIGLRATDGVFSMPECSGNVFDGTGPLPDFCGCSLANDLAPTYGFQSNQGYAGILINGIGLLSGASLTINSPNTFQDLAAGIVVDNANATINKCKFFDIQRYGYPQYAGFGIRFVDNAGGRKLVENGTGKGDNNFNRVEHCIYAVTDKQNTEASIAINNMDNIQFGVTVESPSDQGNGTIGNFKKVTVATNYIRVNTDYGFEPGGYGIKISDHDMAASTNIVVNLNHPVVDLPIEPNTQLPVAIWVLGTEDDKSTTTTKVYFNNPIEMFDGVDGIRLDNMSNAYVSYNEVYLKQTVPENFESTGIRFSGGRGNTGECNFIFDESPLNEVTGFFVDGHKNGFYWKNNMFSTNHGMTFRMDCDDPNDIWANIFWYDMDIALYYQGVNAKTGPQVNKGNLWYDDNPAAGWGALNEGNPSASMYTSVPPAIYTPALIYPPVPFWFTTNGNSPITAGCDFAVSERQPEAAYVSSIDNSLASGSLTGFDPGAVWSMKQNLYRKLDEHPSLTSGSTTMDSFMTANASASLGKLYEVRQDIRALFDLDTSTQSTVASNDSIIETAFGQLAVVDSLLTSQPDDSLLLLNRENLLDAIEQATDANNTVYSLWQSNRSSAADAVIAANAAVSTTGVPDLNEKKLNDLYLKKAAKNQWTLDASDMALLDGIAHQCPEYGGPAVYWARSWYASLTNTPINPFNCVGSRNSETSDAVQPDTVYLVYPNPSGGMFILLCPASETGRQVEVFNMTGQLLKRLVVENTSVKQQIDLQGLNNGIYLLRVTEAGRTVLGQRVSIVH